VTNDGVIILPDVSARVRSAFNVFYTTSPGMTLTIDDWETIPFNSEAVDLTGDFNSSTGVFTAPVSGIYALSATVMLTLLERAVVGLKIRIVTSNHSYEKTVPVVHYDAGSDPDHNMGLSLSIFCDMDTADTAYVQIYQDGGTTEANVHPVYSWFSGGLRMRT